MLPAVREPKGVILHYHHEPPRNEKEYSLAPPKEKSDRGRRLRISITSGFQSMITEPP